MDQSAMNAKRSEPVERWLAMAKDPPAPTDAELLELYRHSRNSKELEEIVRRHSPLVASVIRRLISNAQDAEDAFQATFLVLVLSAKKIRNPESLGSWLYGVAFRTAKRLRSQRRNDNMKMLRQSAVGIDLGEAPSPVEEPLAIIARELQLAAMDEELSRLPKHLRDALVEHYMVGSSVPEIARCLNLSVTAVEGRIKRGRKALRMQLAMRGVSLTVVAATCVRFQQEVVATSADPWAIRFLEFVGNANVGELSLTQFLDSNTVSKQLMKLVQGEVVVNTFSRSVVGVAGGILVLCAMGTIGFLSAQANQNAKSASSGIAETGAVETLPQASSELSTQESESFVLAQQGINGTSGGETGTSGGPASGSAKISSPAQGQRRELALKWEKSPGSTPEWLGPETDDRPLEQKIRRVLNESGEVNFNAMPLSQVMKYFRNLYEIPIYIDERGLAEAGVTHDEPITLELPTTSLRNALSLILKPLGLTYVINKGCMVITDHRFGTWTPIRYYDVSHILPDNGLTNEIISAIESLIVSDRSCSVRCIGSMLVVKADEETNYEIQRMLRSLSEQSPANLKPREFADKPDGKPSASKR